MVFKMEYNELHFELVDGSLIIFSVIIAMSMNFVFQREKSVLLGAAAKLSDKQLKNKVIFIIAKGLKFHIHSKKWYL